MATEDIQSTQDTPTGAENQDAPTGGADDSQATVEKSYTQGDFERVLQARLARQAKQLEKKFSEQAEQAMSQHLSQWREEQGLTDEALEQIQGRDKAAAEVRVLKGRATKAENALKAESDSRTRAEAQLERLLVDDAIMAAAASTANNPKEIVALLRPRVRIDKDGGYSQFVIGDDGEPSGQTVEELVQEYLEQNDHHMRPQGGRGAGSIVRSPGGGGGSGGAADTPEGRLAILKRGGLG